MMARPLARTVCGAFKVACSLRRRSGVPLRFGSGTARRQFCVGVSQCNGDQSSSHAVEAPQDGLPLLGPEEEKESRGVGDSLVADSISQCCLMSLILKDCEQPIHVRGCEELENCANSTVLKSFYLIDVRKQWELYHGMIPGARHIPCMLSVIQRTGRRRAEAWNRREAEASDGNEGEGRRRE